MIHHDLVEPLIEGLWHGAVVAIPTALLAGGIIALFRPRPATRHVLWVAVLCSFLMPLAGISITREAPAIAARVSTPLTTSPMPVARPAPSLIEFSPLHEADPVPEFESLSNAGIVQARVSDESPITSPHSSSLGEAFKSTGTTTSVQQLLTPTSIRPAIDRPTTPTRHAPRAEPRHAVDRRAPIAIAFEPDASSPISPTLDASLDSISANALAFKDPIAASAAVPIQPPAPSLRDRLAAAGAVALGVASTSLQLASEQASKASESVQDRAAFLSRSGADALGAIPRMPLWLWFSGICVIVCVAIVRVVSFGRVLRRATPAPADVRRMIDAAADVIGLRRRPVTVMSDQRISPLVWCGLGPTLVLPTTLWSELDDDSRRSIVVHELAHLKRHDHWVGWLALAIGIAYWWHPVVWWARRRLAEEADICCDAWVVSTLPSSRRAYAEALVTTRSFLAVPGRGVPALGLEVMSKRARRLARRLAMIMTKKTAPRTSIRGGALALGLIGVSGLLGPAIACPPEEKAITTTDVPPRAQVVQGHRLAPLAAIPGRPLLATTVEGHAIAPLSTATIIAQPSDSTFEQHMQHGRVAQAEDRFEQLNHRLARLEEVLAQLDARLGGDPAIAVEGFARTTPAPMGWREGAAAVDMGVVARTYSIPEGRLEALVELMKRDDVPIYVSWDDSSITVNAAPDQHDVFRAFCTIICPEGVTVRDENGNPLSMNFNFDAGAYGTFVADAFGEFAAFGDDDEDEAECEDECDDECEDECEAECEDGHDHAHDHAAIEQHRARADQYRAKAEAYRAQHLAMLEQSNALAAQADDLEANVDQVMERVEEIRDAAQELIEQAEQLDGASARELRAKARAMESEARANEREARAIAREAERVHQRAEQAEEEADELESRADELLEQADEIAAELDDMIIEVVPASAPSR